MPKRKDINKVLIIGSGAIVIGQGAEFDYSGTQACLALKELGFETVLINPNPATIMTDGDIANIVYIEPLVVKNLERIIKKERPDALLGTFGGQTGLNLTMELSNKGILSKYKCKVIGTNIESIECAENREKFLNLCKKMGYKCVKSRIANNENEIFEVAKEIGFPVILRPAFTLGGSGGAFAENEEELLNLGAKALKTSPINQVLVEKSIKGFKEIEYEIIRDFSGTAISVCNMENFDPVGVHTGDSIVICPSQTLSNKEYQMLRTAAINIVNELKIEGGCNVQFAVNPDGFDFFFIEINPRVSRSSALASKASGYPIARVSAMIACGLKLEEIKISSTIASFEPSLDYVVIKIPRFPFDKFSKASRKLNTQMKSTGEVMSIGRSFEESLLKAIRSLDIGIDHIWLEKFNSFSLPKLYDLIKDPSDEQIFIIAQIFRIGGSVLKVKNITKISVFFLNKIKNIVELEKEIYDNNLSLDVLLKLKKNGFSDAFIAHLCKKTFKEILEIRRLNKIMPVYKMIDTCASEFCSYVPYFYSTYNGTENESEINLSKKVVVLGSGPIRIGQGTEFDYSTVHAILTLRKYNYEVIVINNNPSTVSTDYTISNKLYFEPLCVEDIVNILDYEKPEGVIVSLGGQTSINLAQDLSFFGAKIIGTQVFSIKKSEDRNEFEKFLDKLSISRPMGRIIYSKYEGLKASEELGYPVLIRPSFVLGGRAMQIINNKSELELYLDEACQISNGNSILMDKYVLGKELEVDAICDGEEVIIPGVMEHLEKTGVHSGDSIIVYPTFSISKKIKEKIVDYTQKLGLGLGIIGNFNVQYIVDSEDNIYVIEVNPRCSRTIPFISKSQNLNLAELATKIQIGFKLKDMKLADKVSENRWFVKVPVFSFAKILGADTYLSPEMKSTGEVMGHGETLNEAFFNALRAANFNMQFTGNVLISVSDGHKEQILSIVDKFIGLGFKVEATHGTYDFISKYNLKNIVSRKKMSEGSNEILDLISKGKYSYIINTLSSSDVNGNDGFLIRRCAAENNTSIFTSLDTANMFLNILKEKIEGNFREN